MNLFTKTFFHFALGFVGIILISATIIIIGNAWDEPEVSEGECLNCAGN